MQDWRRRLDPQYQPPARVHIDLPVTSLLWPSGRAPRPAESAAWENDLGLAEIVNALSLNGRYTPFVRQVLSTLMTEVEIIQWRQRVLHDFVQNPVLVTQILPLLPELAALQQGNALLGKRQRNLLLETADHLSELESYVRIVEVLHGALRAAELTASALIQVRDDLERIMQEPNFQRLQVELPDLRAPLQDIRSLTIGLNLDLELKPESAVLLAINSSKFSEQRSWLDRVIGVRSDPNSEAGIAELHRVPEDPDMRPLSQLFQDLDRLLTQVARPVAKALTQYARGGSGSLLHLEYELAFFAGAARMITRIEARGIRCCVPDILPLESRVIECDQLVNTALALRADAAPVPSTVRFNTEGRIAVLTGPNSGGKTTYLRGIGLVLVLAQAGLMIPAEAARISPIDQLLTHFPALESRQHGRLAEEALRLRELFQKTTAHSLVLLNETFSSTSSGEALYLAQDMLAALRAVGSRAIYATHLIELAERLDEIEGLAAGDCRLISLVAGVHVNAEGGGTPTYVITPGVPHARSYAQDIARKHGISLAQILEGRPQ
jgi:DNA mismatch repair protein MutS